MAAKAFIEQYLECTDSLPLDIQRVISQYWELDNKTKDLLSEARCVRAKSEVAVSESVATCRERQNWLMKLQQVMLALREVGNEKVELTSQMLDLVEEYSQQLLLTEKEMDSCRTRDELTGTRSSSVAHIYKNSTSVSGLGEFNEVRKKGERHQKRSRNAAHEHNEEELPPFSMTPPIKDNNKKKDVVVPMPAPNTLPSIKPPKKKIKVKKKTTTTSTKESQPLPLIPPGVVIPQPDFTSEPIDPDEPTYCLCNQVSFGEMIGCDNEECQIEWFHFQCVGLTSKPKGKWFCPRCQPERIKHNRSSK